MKCTLIIPAYNEEMVIAETVQTLSGVFAEHLTSRGHTWSIVVVDNASTDRTSECVLLLHDPSVSVLSLSEKGKGRAVRAGMMSASDADIVGFTDADLSVPPDEIVAAFLAACDRPDHVFFGSRAHPESITPGREWWRTGSSRIFNLLTRLLLDVRLRDTQCPLKVMGRSGRSVLLATQENSWFFDLEFFLLADRLGLPLVELPVTWEEHRYPERKSKLSTMRDGIRSIPAMLRIRRRLGGAIGGTCKNTS